MKLVKRALPWVLAAILMILTITGTRLSRHQYKWIKTDIDEIIEKLENKEDCIIYFGYTGCPWCDEATPVLQEVAEEARVEILYGETKNKAKSEDEEDWVISKEQISKIRPYLEEYDEYIDNDGEFHFYVPTLLVMKNGGVQSHHMGTVDDHNPSQAKMTEDQKAELVEIYKGMLKEDSLCIWK